MMGKARHRATRSGMFDKLIRDMRLGGYCLAAGVGLCLVGEGRC
jgi:hypothetical protein